MACRARRDPASRETTPWTVTVVQPRASQGETSLYLRARRRHEGRDRDHRRSTETLDPHEAELQRARLEAELNGGTGLGPTTLPQAMEARIVDLERAAARGQKSEESVDAFRTAQKKLAEVLDTSRIDRAGLLRARDTLLGPPHELGPETVNTYFRRAGACWRWAEERGLVTTPWPRVKALPKPPRTKRPYTPTEVEDVLAWLATYEEGRWHALLCVVAEAGGRRVSEVCRLQGRDVARAELELRFRQKGNRVLTVPISAETMALLPEVAPDAWLFPSQGDHRTGSKVGPARRDTAWKVVKRAIKALGIRDGERLDVHSFRRSFAAHGHRAGLPNDVLRRLTGHEVEAMLGHYQRDTVGDDLRGALTAVLDYRAAEVDAAKARAAAGAAPPTNLPASPTVGGGEVAGNDGSRDTVAASDGAMRSRTSDLVLIRSDASRPHGPTLPAVVSTGQGEDRAPARHEACPSSPGARLFARIDPRLAVVARWADENPDAMRWLLESAELRAHLAVALQDLAPGQAPAGADAAAQ